MSRKMTAEEWEEKWAWAGQCTHPHLTWDKWNNAGLEKSVAVDCSSGWERIGKCRGGR